MLTILDSRILPDNVLATKLFLQEDTLPARPPASCSDEPDHLETLKATLF